MSESEAEGKNLLPKLVQPTLDTAVIANLPVYEFIKKIMELDREELLGLLAFFKGYYDHAERRVDSGGVMG